MKRGCLFMALGFALGVPNALASAPCTTPAMIVFDGSRSMNSWGFGQHRNPRILDVRLAMRETLPKLERDRDIGLITFGAGEEGYCSNVDVQVLPRQETALEIIEVIDEIKPDGATPMVKAVTKAVEVLEDDFKEGTIVLLSDGAENCAGKPCELAQQLRVDHPSITVNVIAFRLNDPRQWAKPLKVTVPAHAEFVARCLADQTGGKYISAEDADGLSKALDELLGCPLIGHLAPKRVRA